MDAKTFQVLYDDAVKAILREQLSDALSALKGLAVNLQFPADSWQAVMIPDALQQLTENYRMLLHYWEKGVDDPARKTMHQQFLRQASEIADNYYFAQLLEEDNSYFSSVWKRTHERASAASSLSEQFEATYASAPWGKEESQMQRQRFADATNSIEEQQTMAAALFLSTLEVFDPKKLQILLEGAVSAPPKVRARCIVGVLLLLIRYAGRLRFYPELEAQLTLLQDDAAFVDTLHKVQAQLFLSIQTQQDNKKMREDIMPELLKAAHKLKDLTKGDLSNLVEINEAHLNPEWDADGEKSKISKKMHEFLEMQQRGSDTFYTTFAQISRQQAFFNDAANWFMPFSYSNPIFGSRGEAYSSMDAVFNNRPVCDTEKYCMVFMLQSLTDEQLHNLGDGVRKMSDIPEELMDTFDSGEEELQQQIRFYLQDLYRFFHLFRFRNEHNNPFKLDLSLISYPHLRPFFSSVPIALQFANSCFKKELWKEALSFFMVIPPEQRTASVLEKMGYAEELWGFVSEAVEYYEEALRLHPDSVWTLRQLGRLNVAAGNYEEALDYYERLEALCPEDVDLLLRIGECYMSLRQPKLAFSVLYKADYLQPEGKALRALAWCSLLSGNLEQAETYYSKILTLNPSASDYFNAGHSAWLNHNIAEAVHRYQASAESSKLDFVPSDFFEDDAWLLKEYGVTRNELLLMRDAINDKIN